jgi:hypothetical protein
MNQELPKRTPHEPPIEGPHEVVGEEGITHHYVFAGSPNARKTATSTPPISRTEIDAVAASLEPKPQHWLVHYLWATALVFSWVIGAITAGLLGLEYGQLTLTSRLVCGTISALAAAGYVTHTIRRRKVRS